MREVILGVFFHNTLGVHQEHIPNARTIQLLFGEIMQKTLYDRRNLNFYRWETHMQPIRFSDDIDLIAGTNSELQDQLTDRQGKCIWNADLD